MTNPNAANPGLSIHLTRNSDPHSKLKCVHGSLRGESPHPVFVGSIQNFVVESCPGLTNLVQPRSRPPLDAHRRYLFLLAFLLVVQVSEPAHEETKAANQKQNRNLKRGVYTFFLSCFVYNKSIRSVVTPTDHAVLV